MRKLLVVLFALTAALVACGEDDGDDVTTEGEEETTGAVEISAQDFRFDPADAESGSGTVPVRITNDGDAPHTFTVDGQGVDEELQPGDTVDVDVEVPDGGGIDFYCRFHRDSQGMEGTLAGGAGSSGTTPAETPTTSTGDGGSRY